MKPHKLMIGDWVEAEVQVDDTGTEPVFEKLRKRVTDIYTIGHRVEISLDARWIITFSLFFHARM